jgi:hypothetical protein
VDGKRKEGKAGRAMAPFELRHVAQSFPIAQTDDLGVDMFSAIRVLARL